MTTGRRSSIDSPPKEVRRWLERALMENNLTGYTEFESLLKEKGYSITRPSPQRSGYKMEQQLAWVRAAIEAACLFAWGAGDDPNDHPAGLIILVQTEVTDILMRLQESRENGDPLARAKLPVTASKGTATLTRASVNPKRHQAEVRERVERATAAAGKIIHKGGLPAEAVQALRREIPGVVS